MGVYKTPTITGVDTSKSNDPNHKDREGTPERRKKSMEGKRTNERNVHSTFGQRSTLGRPSQTVLQDPSVEVVLRFLREAKVRGSDALEDVVVVLRSPKDRRRRVRHVPKQERKRISIPNQSGRRLKRSKCGMRQENVSVLRR